MKDLDVYFSDYFDVNPELLEEYGAFNISLINDLPLFVDPFLLFNSDSDTYKELHKTLIDYVIFLKKLALSGKLSSGAIKEYFYFPEVKQNWFGYSLTGNKGSGLGVDFANSLVKNLSTVFTSFGDEEITESSHLEKLALIKNGVGRDNISDLTVNIIKPYLLEYTQSFALENIAEDKLKDFRISKAVFDFDKQAWKEQTYKLPFIIDPDTGKKEFVLITPKDLLTKDDTWISRSDLYDRISEIPDSVDDDQLRAKMNQHLLSRLATSDGKEPTKKQRNEAAESLLTEFPELIDYYIKVKEEDGNEAQNISDEKVQRSDQLYVTNIRELIKELHTKTEFYNYDGDDTYDSVMKRVVYLKGVIENNDGYRYFYVDGVPYERESDLGILYRLTWYGTKYSYDTEVNNGRGPVDGKSSMGSADSTLVEFKLASNSKLKQNLEKQVEIYKEANNTRKAIKVILYFDDDQLDRVNRILEELELKGDQNIVLIDARKKESASNAR